MERVFKNYVTVRGRVQNYEFNEYVDDKRLGDLTLRVNDGNAYIKIWNPRDADKNYVAKFFKEIEKGQKIQIQGRIEEEFYNDQFQRRVRVSAKNGVNYKVLPEDQEEKHVVVFAGDVIEEPDFGYENVERFGSEPIGKLEFTLVNFNQYNPETQENDFTIKEVIERTFDNYLGYLRNKKKPSESDINTVEKLKSKLDENDIEVCYKALLKFYDLFNPRMYNVDLVHFIAYDSFAKEIGNKIDTYDNVDLAATVNNFTEKDEFEVVTGYVNEVEAKKIYDVNKYEPIEDDDFLDF
ncbi:MAG: hypothetical protein ACOC4L_01600 [Halanaerobium sp.]